MAGKSVLKNYGLLIFWIFFLIAVAVFILLNQERIHNALQNGSKTATPQPVSLPEDIFIPQPVFEEADPTPVLSQETELTIVDTVEEPLLVSEPAEVQVQSALTDERKRNMYFIHVNDTGTISQVQIQRLLPASDTPLLDLLRVLFKGPTSAELKQNLISLIPDNTTILSVEVRNGTAYINTSEELQYNQFGQEGHYACLKQIVWTATEFSTVQNVQILIEGAKVNYLSEGIWTGSPLSREDF